MSRLLPDGPGLLGAAAAAALDDSPDSPPSKSDSESECSSPNSKHLSPRGKLNEDQPAGMATYNDAFVKQLEELKTKQSINDQLTLMSQQSRLLGEMFNPLQLAATAGYPFFMPQYSALASTMPAFDYMNPYASSMMMPYMPELMKNLTQKQLETGRIGHTSTSKHNSMVRKSEPNTNNKPPKNGKDDIKVPAYKPSVTSQTNGDLTSTVARKGVKSSLSREKLEKLGEVPPAFTATNYLQNMSAQSASTSKRSSPTHSSHMSNKKSLIDHSPTSHHAHSSLSNGNSSGKKRPKRGQYRKYDSELLAQAVKAVQRGEMSVHRAGTFFGVPHSTLEYKVKERHLLRKKKIAENSENKAASLASTAGGVSQNKSAVANTTCNNSSDSNQSGCKTSPVSFNLSVAETVQPSADMESKVSGFTEFSSPYNQQATELLMKLQAKAHQQANEIMKDTNNSQSIENKDTSQSQFSIASLSN